MRMRRVEQQAQLTFVAQLGIQPCVIENVVAM